MRPFFLTLAVVAGLGLLAVLPLIPELAPLRQGTILSVGLVSLSLIVVNAKRRWSALPDLRRAIALWSVLSAVLCAAGVLSCMMLSTVGGLQRGCSVRVSQLMYAPTGHAELTPGRTTYRFTEQCAEQEASYLQQSRLLFMVAPKIPEAG